jgi:proline iminopeptidase
MKTRSLFRWFLLFSLISSVSPLRASDSGDTPSGQGKLTRYTVYPIKEGFVDVNGLFLYYTELGQGQPLIILHGGPGGTHNHLLPYLLPLARTNRIIFMDERGSGRSGKLEDASGYTVENMVEDVEALRQALGLGSINLLGHSFGGVVAQAYALKYQKNLSHLILANTFDSTNELNEVWARLKTKIDPQHLRRIEELEKEGLFDKGKPWEHGRYTAEYAELAWGWAYYPYMYENHPNPNYNPLGSLGIAWDVYREMSGSNGEFVIDGNMKSVEYAEKLRTIRVSTLVIAGEHDEWSLQMSEEMHSNISGSQLAVLPKSKHMTFVDQNAMFNNKVDAFIHSRPLSSTKAGLFYCEGRWGPEETCIRSAQMWRENSLTDK